MTTYTIYCPNPETRIQRKRIDAARAALIRATYDIIKAFAGLDTAWGHKAMEDATRLDWVKGGTITNTHFTIFCTRSI